MRRKKYSRPVVESETVFEQTSLACTTTKWWQEDRVTIVYFCEEDVTKGANFDDLLPCGAVVLRTVCVVVLS